MADARKLLSDAHDNAHAAAELLLVARRTPCEKAALLRHVDSAIGLLGTAQRFAARAREMCEPT